jgi:hypothetical protein
VLFPLKYLLFSACLIISPLPPYFHTFPHESRTRSCYYTARRPRNQGTICGRDKMFFSSPYSPDRLWPHSAFYLMSTKSLFRDVQLTTYLHHVPRPWIVELHLHCPISFLEVVLSSLSPWITLPFIFLGTVCGSISCWRTTLNAVRWQVRVPMRSLHFFSIDVTLPAALWLYGRLSL